MSMSTTEMSHRKIRERDRVGAVRADLRARTERLVRERPILAVLGAGLLGAALGGTIFRRASQLLFLTAAGFVLAELWKREGRMDVQGLLSHLTGDEPSPR